MNHSDLQLLIESGWLRCPSCNMVGGVMVYDVETTTVIGCDGCTEQTKLHHSELVRNAELENKWP